MPDSDLQRAGKPRTDCRLSAIVLAAGASVRMGAANKLLLLVEGRPLVAHVVDAVARAKISELVVVTGHQPDRLRAALAGRGAEFAHNPAYEHGMSTSIRAGVDAASKSCSGYMICLADLPMIATGEYDALIDAFCRANATDPMAIVRPVYRGQPGHPVILAAAYRKEIAAPVAMAGCRSIVKRHRARVTEIDWATDHVVRDVDTRASYESLVAECVAGA